MANGGPAARLLIGALCAALLGACGSNPAPSAPPTASPAVPTASAAATSVPATPSATTAAVLGPASAAAVTSWQAATVAFADRFNRLHDDAAAAFAAFTDDARILDPSNADFYIGPKSEIVRLWRGWMTASLSYDARTIGTYVSSSAAAVLTDVAVEWPPSEPPTTPPLVHELRIFRFAGQPAASVTTFELWYRLDGLEAGKGTCFELHDCGPALRTFIDRYLEAWSKSDRAAISVLYADSATFSDGTLGISAAGSAQIAALATGRYGEGHPGGCSLRDAYLVMNDGDPAVSDWNDPDGGKAAGIALATTCPVGTAGRTVASVSVLMLGTWSPTGYRLDPDGRIVREETFYDATSLVAAGVVR